jgi:hypothetical protein
MICCELYPSSTPELHLHLGLSMMALAQFRVGTPREFASPLVQADGETDRCRLIMRCAHLTGVYVYDRYELSLTGSYVAAPVGPSNPKRRKTEPAADVPDASAGGSAVEGDAVVSRVNVDDFDAMRDRISAYDSAREDVIKRCRDPQKMSKQVSILVWLGCQIPEHNSWSRANTGTRVSMTSSGNLCDASRQSRRSTGAAGEGQEHRGGNFRRAHQGRQHSPLRVVLERA